MTQKIINEQVQYQHTYYWIATDLYVVNDLLFCYSQNTLFCYKRGQLHKHLFLHYGERYWENKKIFPLNINLVPYIFHILQSSDHSHILSIRVNPQFPYTQILSHTRHHINLPTYMENIRKSQELFPEKSTYILNHSRILDLTC